MTIRRTYLWGALAATVAASAALAQESNTIGPPALSEFELRPGARTPAAEPEPIIAPLARPPAESPARRSSTPPVVSIPAPAAPTVTRPAQPSPRRRIDAQPDTATVAAPDPAVGTPDPAPVATFSIDPTEPVSDLLETDAPASPPLASAPDAGGFGWWIYALFGMLAAGIATLFLRRRNRLAPAAAAPVARAAAPLPAGSPLASEPATAVARPWIEIEFIPTQAGANESQAAVQFELMLRNIGESEARDVRVEARLFNAGAMQDREIGAFFAQPNRDGAVAPVPISPQTQIPYRSSAILPRSEVREVAVQGRRLFIPMVAFNVLYRWGENGSGQTSASYLVGVESTPPAEKMGAFRLDLGPRIYRSVGQRRHRLARTL